MAKGVDSLIEWCVREISFSNDEGLTPQSFLVAVKNFFNGTEGDGPPDNDEEAEQQAARNEVTTLQDDPAAFEIAATAWDHISARPEISVGFNRLDRSWNHLSFRDVYHLPPSPPKGKVNPSPGGQSPGDANDIPSAQPCIFTLEEVTWLNITGHGIDTSRIPPLYWKLLVVLASCHQHGATQANLCRLGGGDSRSVPLRTHRLADQGYLVKRTVVLRGCKTSKLWLTQFAPPELPSTDSPETWGRDLDLSPSNLTKDLRPVAWCTSWTGTTIDYEAFGRSIIAIIKAWEVLRTVDLKNKLGIHGVRWQMKVLARILRRFAGAGIIGYVAASLGDSGRIFKDCIKFLRDPSEAEWSSYLSTGGGKSKEQRASAQAKKKIEQGEPAEEKGADVAGLKGCMSAQLSKWTPDKPLVNQVHETIKRAASQGISVPQISALTVGYAFRRYMDSLMPFLANPSVQPARLGHFTINLDTRTARLKVYTTDTSNGPELPRGIVAAALSGELSPAAAQEKFGFPAVPEPLAATRSNANLTALGRIRHNTAPRANLPRDLVAGKRRFVLFEDPIPEPPAKRARRSRTTNEADMDNGLDLSLCVDATLPASTQVEGERKEKEKAKESLEEVALQEPEPIPKREIEPGIRAYIGEASSAPKRRGRPPRNAPKRLLFTFVGEKVQAWQLPQDSDAVDQSAATAQETSAMSTAAILRQKTPTPESLPEPEPEEEMVPANPGPEPQPPSKAAAEEAALDNAVSDIVLEARYNGRSGQLRLASQEREVLFEFSPFIAGKKPLKIAFDDILENPKIEVPPDEDDKCLVINVSRNDSRWPYLFHFDNIPEVCDAASTFQRKLETFKTMANADSEPKASEPPVPEVPDSDAGQPELEEPEPRSSTPQPQSQPHGKRKRQLVASPSTGLFRCRQCGATYKNREGLKYHQQKSQTSCNPDFIVTPIHVESVKRRRITFGYDESESQQKAMVGGPRKFREKRMVAVTSPAKSSRGLSRKAAQKPVEAGIGLPAMGSAEKEVANGTDVSMAEPPSADGSGLAVNDGAVTENAEPSESTPVTGEANEKTPERNDQETPKQVIGPDGLPVFVLPICSNPKVLPSSHRTMAVIMYLIEANGGIFPGDKGLWFAVFSIHLKHFPEESPPSLRSVQALAKTLEKRKSLRIQTYAWRDLKGSSSSLSLVIKSDVPDASPLIPEVKEKIQAVHPEPYVPALFAPSLEIRAILEVKIQEEVARMNGRSKRKLPGEVEVLKAPFYEVARNVRLVRQELSDHEPDEAGPDDWNSRFSTGGTDGPGDRSAWLASRLVRLSGLGMGRRRRRLLPDSRPRKYRRLEYPRNPGLDTLPRSFFTSHHTAEDVACPPVRFLPLLSTAGVSRVDYATDTESTSGSDSTSDGRSPRVQVHEAPTEAVTSSTTADSSSDPARDAVSYSFADSISLRGLGDPGKGWPALDESYFRDNDGSVSMPDDSKPDKKLILSQHIPRNLEEIPHKEKYKLDEWRDPHWGEFAWHVESCREWELSEDMSHLLQSSSLAPDYRFLNFAVNPDVMKVDHSLPEPVQSVLKWVPGNQFTVNSLPYFTLSEEVERYERSATGIRHHHLLFSHRRGRGGRGGGMGRGGSRGGARSRFGSAGHSRGGAFENGYRVRAYGGGRRPRGARLHRVPQFKKVRELSAFPHAQEEYFETRAVSDDIDWSTHDTRIAAFVVVRTLLGGVDKTIDWGVMMRLFPDTRLSALRKFWTEARKVRGYYIEVTTEKFQDAYLAAYEREEVPPLNYDDVLAYDWRGLVRWTVTTVIRQVVRLPTTRSRLEHDYLINETAYKPLEWRDTYFHFQRSVWKRFQDATSEPAAIPAVGRSHKGQVSLSVEEIVATTWIRALCSTPRELYSPSSIKEKVQTLGIESDEELGRLLENVIFQLQVRRVICKSKASAFRSGRPYRYTKHFSEALKKSSQASKFVQAAAYKRRLDALCRSGGGAMGFPYAPDDGAVMAIFNLQANGRVRVEPVGAPDIPMGFEPGNYETRKYSKDLYTFGLRVVPTNRYVCDEDIPVLALAGRTPAPGAGSRGELPTWCDFLARPDAGRWAAVAGAVFFALATRGSMDAERTSEALKPLTEVFDVQAVMGWGLSVGILGELVGGGGGGVCVEEWWWLAVARLFEAGDAEAGAESSQMEAAAVASTT
ncbi:hypothetical protein RB595_007371 [Gaeumannomyces hyphopodioides]